jgi:hypothetical protein
MDIYRGQATLPSNGHAIKAANFKALAAQY